ncbi:hypothetical protein ASPCAL03554 [Aspergillus calidoustus]|uniref:Uncharacterized protein n=1 Tax=Aspergillus calidoustus TaxID=454130 RepID=A0A0U5FZ14_ASPCI|nr:hypothetical protein ASPCAL03554 [Aspergillus calidoustus]
MLGFSSTTHTLPPSSPSRHSGYSVLSNDAQAQADSPQSGTIRYPGVVSFANTNEGAIIHTFGTLLKWRYEKDTHDPVSRMDHEVAFMDVANDAVTSIAIVHFTVPDSKYAQCFRLKEGPDIAITFAPDKSMETEPNER